ncbi:MAG: formylglycine-generating enzyme family protein [Candidatus Riflebacteria bacterium]|nr:formylglycine-generating enzyme family protein [Candidatus Riflebacteria bacterium]
MNYWYSKPHWDYDREKLCFIEISDSKEHDEHSNPIDEPRPGSVIKVVDDYYSCSKFTEISEEAQEEDSQGSSNNIDKDKIGTDEVRIENIWILKDIALEMIYCPKGSFRMGSPKKREEYPHEVKLTKPFYIGKYPVTQMQYYAIMKKQPSFFKGEDRPVESVSWDDAKEFVENINFLYKRQLPQGYKFALPSEAQWEYACRAGTTSDLNNGRNIISGTGKSESLDEVAFYSQNSDDKTHPVGKKKPNNWGIYDMHGNVCEWCEDIYDYYPERDVTDPTGPESGSYHVLRGGSYLSNPGTCRSASRYYNYHDDKQKFMGFRLAMIKE